MRNSLNKGINMIGPNYFCDQCEQCKNFSDSGGELFGSTPSCSVSPLVPHVERQSADETQTELNNMEYEDPCHAFKQKSMKA